ncbi:MAG TPA: O-antigen ligase family protein [Candidatus Competibacter sp.]|nr:O-antigen ligase family protein [Candidatus Competibacter sp.]
MKKIVILRDHLRDAFFRWGWLVPTVLPLTQLGGRGLFNSAAGLYALWGLSSFWSRRERLDRLTTLLYVLLLGIYLLGIPGSVDLKRGFRLWMEFGLESLSLLLMQMALRESPANPNRFVNAMALFGGLTIGGLYLLLPYHALGWSGQPFDPTRLRQDSLPLLLPFVLYWFWRQDYGRWRYGAMAGAVVVVLSYIVAAEGRAALFGLVVGLMVFCGTVLGWRLRWIALVGVAVLLAGIAAHTGPFRKAELDPDHPLDAFTAGRTILWRQALQHPPARPWLGVGIGSGIHAEEVLRFKIGDTSVQVKHLHNFLLDAWYETGILGAGLLLALIGVVFGRLARAWRRLPAEDRQRSGVLLAAALAIIAAGLLSFGYTSQNFACFFFVCLGGLVHFGRAHRQELISPAGGTIRDQH